MHFAVTHIRISCWWVTECVYTDCVPVPACLVPANYRSPTAAAEIRDESIKNRFYFTLPSKWKLALHIAFCPIFCTTVCTVKSGMEIMKVLGSPVLFWVQKVEVKVTEVNILTLLDRSRFFIEFTRLPQSWPANSLSPALGWTYGDHFVGKTPVIGQPNRPTQPFILPASINE